LITREDLLILLSAVVEGLEAKGYKQQGGSGVYRILENDDQGIKVFFNNYKNPTHIITKISYKKGDYSG
jgi:hypothetical protein